MDSRQGVLSSQGTTAAAALIGAVLGSLGGVLLEGLLEIRQSESVAKESLVQRYVYDLQEGAESLQWRVRNADKHGGVNKMPDEYYVTSTMYALCRVLAADRILIVDGVYTICDNNKADRF